MRPVCLTSLMAIGVLSVAAALRAEELPDDAQRLVAAFEEDAEAIRYEAERRIAAQKQELIAQLQVLQDQHTRAARLDEAVAIRDQIRSLRQSIVPAQPDPGNMLNFQGQVGRRFYFQVTGNASGSVYGTDVYTADSTLATAAVHAGAIGDGETGIVKATVLPGRASYASSTRHGITSNAWGGYSLSFQVEQVKEFPEAAPKADPQADGAKSPKSDRPKTD